MKLKTLTEYATKIQQCCAAPDVLAEILIEMTAHYAYLNEQHIIYKLEKACSHDKIKFHYTLEGELVEREKPLSDTATEQKWRMTETGKKEYRMKREINAMEKMMKNLNTSLYSMGRENYTNSYVQK
jgi:hypothetical protein